MNEKITYIMDPLCGWSYGNSNNFSDFYKEYKDIYEFEIIAGGIKVNDQVSVGGSRMAKYVKTASKRIAQRSGAIFSDNYFNNLAMNPNYTFDSMPASKAITCVKILSPNQSIPYAHRLQLAQFEEGKDNNNEEILADIAMEFGIAKKDFLSMYRSELASSTTKEDFTKVRQMQVELFPSIYVFFGTKYTMIGSGFMTVEEMRRAISVCFVDLKKY